MSLTTTKVDFFVGIDIGQINDSTAIAVVERHRAVPREGIRWPDVQAEARKEARETPHRLDLVHTHCIPLGVQYPAQVAEILEIMRSPWLRGAPVYLDATGVGLGPFQMLRKEGLRNMHSIKITGSTGPAKETPDGWNVGKAELVTAVQIEMQCGRLRLGSRVPNAATLQRELKEFRQRQSPSGHLSFNAREGQHDDLVLALSYAVFGALRPTPSTDMQVRWAA